MSEQSVSQLGFARPFVLGYINSATSSVNQPPLSLTSLESSDMQIILTSSDGKTFQVDSENVKQWKGLMEMLEERVSPLQNAYKLIIEL